MPCYDPHIDEDRAETKRRLDLATRVACELSEKIYPDIALTKETSNWIKQHREFDRQRNEG